MNSSFAPMPNGNGQPQPATRRIDPTLIAHMTRNEADMAFRKRVQTIFEWIEPTDDKVILDMPCGRGFYLNMIRYVSNCKLVGADLDWDVIQKARRNVGHLPDILINNANIYALPYPDNSFDGVILSEVLEHIDDDVAGLKEIYRVLKPGGVVAITVPNADYPFWWDPINKTLEFLFKRPIRHGTFAGLGEPRAPLPARPTAGRGARGGLYSGRAARFHSRLFPVHPQSGLRHRQAAARIRPAARKHGECC